jgi:3-methylcrotonyl-CoA carboxylase alpha subunit
MFQKILIANRGEIACRVIATARRLGIASVAVYSDADAQARHVDLADEAWPLGAAPARESYLAIEKILDAARRSGAQAVHPGYGFLAENPDFAQSCAEAGLVFIGPTPRAIRVMGSKAASKALMEKAGVPVVPGYYGGAQDVADFVRTAERIGFPVLVKASAGGGGKGMRIVECASDLPSAVESAKREALSSFGSDELLIEKRLVRPRHVEMQIFGDAHGHIVAFAERDCSIQRRHQKIIEETPAPGLDAALREALRSAAVAAGASVGYVGAGTVEFLLDGEAFYFLEMNTRLQVEHPITEMVAGQDLVEWQLRVAAGERLPLSQEQLVARGHAMEARIYAEAPERGFLPSIGVIEHLRQPRESADVRIDTGVRRGDAITPYYDPMIAKLIVRGEDREDCVARLRGALHDYEIVGVDSNLELLRAIVASEEFAAGEIDTDFLPRHSELLTQGTGSTEDEQTIVLAAAVAAWLADLRSSVGADRWSPWAAADCWRLNGAGRHSLVLMMEGRKVELSIRPLGDHAFRLEDRARLIDVEAIERDGRMSLRIDGVKQELSVVRRRNEVVVVFAGRNHAVVFPDPLAPPRAASKEDASLTAPLPARVTRVLAAAGDEVKRGATLLTLEAMKMEIALAAPRDGKIAEIRRAIGDMVQQGEELVIFAEEKAA